MIEHLVMGAFHISHGIYEHNRKSKTVEKSIALVDFQGERECDLSFRKGDVITITNRTASIDDWWTGRVNGKSGCMV